MGILIVVTSYSTNSNNFAYGQENILGNCDNNLKIANFLAVGDDGDDAIPSNAFDSNLGTRWSHEGIGSWIRVDLGAPKTICNVEVAWYKGDERAYNFEILASNSGKNFKVIYDGSSSGTSLLPEKYALVDETSKTVTKARYIAIKVNGNVDNLGEENTWAAITEIRIKGK